MNLFSHLKKLFPSKKKDKNQMILREFTKFLKMNNMYVEFKYNFHKFNNNGLYLESRHPSQWISHAFPWRLTLSESYRWEWLSILWMDYCNKNNIKDS